MIKNAYIHVPFCASKCFYCSFVSSCDLNAKDAYVNALKSQIESEYKDEKLNTLYFGGGTPSLLSIEDFKSILELFEFEPDAEITVEVNPDSVDFEYLSALHSLGVNRLSIGTQSFDDKILKSINRRHSSLQAVEAVKSAQKAGFENISLDFIYGLPTQAIDGFEQDLKNAISFGIQHISLYGLKIEDESYFGKNPPKNLPDDEVQAEMYLKAIDVLTKNGFEHYEISNFSRVGFNSRHNLNYWDANTYYGFGCAASGYSINPRPYRERARVRGLRYTNELILKKYIEKPLSKVAKEELTAQDMLEEAIFLGFRKLSGINVPYINKKYAIDFDNKYKRILNKYSEFFQKTDLGYALNVKGILISNEILAEFID